MRAILLLILAATATAAKADELADRLCPLIRQALQSEAAASPEGLQASLVMTIGGSYDFDGTALRQVTDGIDAATGQTCPELRDKALARLGTASLAQALR